jgi:hypothetical protein
MSNLTSLTNNKVLAWNDRFSAEHREQPNMALAPRCRKWEYDHKGHVDACGYGFLDRQEGHFSLCRPAVPLASGSEEQQTILAESWNIFCSLQAGSSKVKFYF